jgi:DNA primase
VSLHSSSDSKDRVKQATDIVDLVGRYITLRRQGRAYVGLCPWHDDSRPSLQVNPERQSWKCWVCDVGGDVFSFVMKMDGVAFPEALAMLAERAGIPLKPDRQEHQEKVPGTLQKRDLLSVMAWVEQQYHDCLLHDPEAEPARRYLQQRSITAESIAKFHLGYSPTRWDWILRRAGSRGPSSKALEAVGVLARSPEGDRVYDRFRGRVLFSIRDVQGRPIALGGRVLPESGSTSPAKYINSPETPLFRKSEQLYGLDVAQSAIRKAGPGHRIAMVMEGYTDCMIAHQCGFENAVAVLGTALGERHVHILKRFADQILLVLDGDEAGQRRTKEVLELFISQSADLRIVTLPEGLDPCDFLLKRGADAFRELLDSSALDALEHAFRVYTRGIDLDRDVHAASEALERLVGIVAKAPRLRPDTTQEDRFRQEKILQRLAASFRVPEGDVRERLTDLRRAAQRHPGPAPRRETAAPSTATAGDPVQVTPTVSQTTSAGRWELAVLELLLQHPECLAEARAALTPDAFAPGAGREIYRMFCSLSDSGELPTFDRLALEFDDPVIQNLLVELDETGAAKKIADPKALLEELLKNYRDVQATKQHPAQAGMLREGGLDDRQQLDLINKIVAEERARHGSSEPTEG